MSALETAAHAITERLRSQAERPATLTVADLIDRRMAGYSGRDTALVTRLATWRILLGEFQVAAVDRDVVHAARTELAELAALEYKGRDHDNRPIFKPKDGGARKAPASASFINGRFALRCTASVQTATASSLRPNCQSASPFS